MTSPARAALRKIEQIGLFSQAEAVPQPGCFIKDTSGEYHLVEYRYLGGNLPQRQMLSCMGLGKWRGYPMNVNDVVRVYPGETSFMASYLEDKYLIWLGDNGHVMLSYPYPSKSQGPEQIDRSGKYVPNLYGRRLYILPPEGDDLYATRQRDQAFAYDYQLAEEAGKMLCIGTFRDLSKVTEQLRDKQVLSQLVNWLAALKDGTLEALPAPFKESFEGDTVMLGASLFFQLPEDQRLRL